MEIHIKNESLLESKNNPGHAFLGRFSDEMKNT